MDHLLCCGWRARYTVPSGWNMPGLKQSSFSFCKFSEDKISLKSKDITVIVQVLKIGFI